MELEKSLVNDNISWASSQALYNAMQCNAMHCIAIQYNTIQYKQEKWTLTTSYLRLKVVKNHNKIAISCLLLNFLCYLYLLFMFKAIIFKAWMYVCGINVGCCEFMLWTRNINDNFMYTWLKNISLT